MTPLLNHALAGLLLAASAAGARAGEDATSPAGSPSFPPAATNLASASPITNGPQRLKKEVRITVITNAPAAGAGATNAPKWFKVGASWQGWDGLHLELRTRTPLTNEADLAALKLAGSDALVQIHLEQVKMTARFGGRLALDGAGFLTSGDLTGFDAGVQLRRARFSMSGDCILLLPVSYQVQVAYNPGQFSIEESYVRFQDLKWLGSLKLGQFQAPMGLDLVTSSRDIVFMEPAAPLQAFAPGNLAGFQIGGPVFGQRATWALGFFAQGTDIEYGNASKDYGSAIARVTWLPLWDVTPESRSPPHFLHLGLSGNVLYSSANTVRFQSRPESYLAPVVIDTGDIDSSGAVTVAGEAAWVNGPFSIQSELLHSFVTTQTGPTLNFGGFYVFASWFLTGESRPYDPRRGEFSRVIPRRNFDFRSGGGAWEVAGRFSHTDLSDGSVKGGRLNLLMGGVNWYVQPHLKWMFNYGLGHVAGGPRDGTMNFFQTRVEVDF